MPLAPLITHTSANVLLGPHLYDPEQVTL
jgi:hypothetical protein